MSIGKVYLSLQTNFARCSKMPEDKKRKKIITKLKHKYRLIIYNDSTFEEVWSKQLSRLNVFSIVGSLSVLLITGVILLIAYTPLREFIPGYPDGNMSRNILLNELKMDSIEREIKIRDQYFNNLKNIIEGNIPVDTHLTKNIEKTIKPDTTEFKKSKEDSILRMEVEIEDSYNLGYNPGKVRTANGIANIKFFPPLKGIITGEFNKLENHYGIDIVSAPQKAISATYDGTVIFSSWTLETGYVIHIQHANNFVSVYKHLLHQLKNLGDHVKTGDAIAIIGNSGEYTSGPHLHFELWYKGQAVDPKKFINF